MARRFLKYNAADDSRAIDRRQRQDYVARPTQFVDQFGLGGRGKRGPRDRANRRCVGWDFKADVHTLFALTNC
jgi:hypothetical protein